MRFVETQLSGHWLVLSIEAILYSSFIYVAAKEGKREIFLSLFFLFFNLFLRGWLGSRNLFEKKIFPGAGRG